MSNAQGVDISVWQDDNTTPQMFDPVKARARGASFAGIKISQASWADPDYAQNWANCKRRLYRMPYHFLTWDVPPARQAETFWSLIEKDTWGLLPLHIDFEWWKVVPAKAMDMLYGCTERLRALSAPLPLGIYTAKTFWDPNGSTASYWKQFHLWLCDISGAVEVPKPWDTHTFHQYTFKLDGPEWGAESLDLDGDYYNGTEAEMIARFNLPALDEPLPAPEPAPAAVTGSVIANGLRMRNAPGIGSSVLGSLNKGTPLSIIERRPDPGGHGHWLHAAVDAWMAEDWLGTEYVEVDE